MAMENLQGVCYAVITPLFIIATVTILLRIYCRGFVLKAFGWDDWTMASLLVINSGQQAVLYVFLHYDAGKHTPAVSPQNMEALIKWLFIEEIYYMFTHCVIKMAFLLFYLRLSREVTFRRWVYFAIALNLMFTLINWLIACLQCIPLDAFFHPAAHPETKCISHFVTFFVPAFLNIATDILILILPIHTVWKLHMTLRRKIQIITVIGFGGVAVLVSMLRLIVLYQFYSDPDFPYILGRMIIISAFEIEIAVIAANMPSIKALWTTVVRKGSASGSGAPSGSYRLSSVDPSKQGRSRGSRPLGGGRGHMSAKDLSAKGTGTWLNESEEELFGKSGQIKVTTDIAVNSVAKTPADDGKTLNKVRYERS